MPAESKAQRRFMAMCEHGKGTRKGCPKGMTKGQMRDFATTKEKGLPERKRKQVRKRKRIHRSAWDQAYRG